MNLAQLRAKLAKLMQRAQDKIGELRDDMDAAARSAIETAHQEILDDIEDVKARIAEKEAEEAAVAAAAAGNDPDDDATRNATTGAAAAEILRLGTSARMTTDEIETALRDGTSVDDFRRIVIDRLAAEVNRTETRPAHIRRDETETRRDALTEALSYRLGTPIPEAGPSEPARPFMEYRRISSFVAEVIGHSGRIDSARAIDDLMDRANTTSDFPAIYEEATNRTLEQRYALAQPTYRRLARRRDFRDFRAHHTIKIGDFPMLEKVAEDGEIKYGTFSEGKETVQAFAYARAISVTRQMIVNDDLGAIAELLTSYGDTVALFEEVIFYNLGLNAKLADNKAVFHTDHNNLAATPSVIDVANVSLGRKSLSKQKTIEGNPMLSNAPRILLCGPDKITSAEMFVASFTPATFSDVNIFSGRLEPLETAQINDNAWYLFPSQESGRCNYRYGMLEGYEAPRVRMKEPFDRQGFSMKVEHDFGVGATDYRFGYKNAGA